MSSVAEADPADRGTEPSAPVPAHGVGLGGVTRCLRRSRATQLDEIRAGVTDGVWVRAGFRSPTDWLATETGEAPGHCRLLVRLAEWIQRVPRVRAAFAAGDLSESALRLLADTWSESNAAAFARDEELLLGWALRLSHRELRSVLDSWRLHADPDQEAADAEQRFEARRLRLLGLGDGMGQLEGVLDPEGFRLVSESIRALSSRLDDDQRSVGQRRADALVSMAKIALGSLQPQPGRKRSRPKVVATIAYHDLLTGDAGGLLETNGLDRAVSSEAIRRLACDAGIHRLVHGPDGTVLDYGRKTRTVSDAQFDVLSLRDHGCRWHGCGAPPAACDAHHAVHWLDCGETELDNLALLCWYHHHLLHEQHWRIEPLGAGHFQLVDPHGGTSTLRAPQIGLALPAS